MRQLRQRVALAGALALAALGALSQPAARLQAQDGAASCEALASAAIESARQACGDMDADSLCYAHAGLTVDIAADAGVPMDAPGQQVNPASVASIQASGADAATGDWGVALLRFRANLPETHPGVEAALFGEATLTPAASAGVSPSGEAVELPVRTFDELPVLLRAGASPNLPQVAQFLQGQEAVVDGRNERGDWVRVRVGDAIGWAWINDVRVTGALEALPVLGETDILPTGQFGAPMQAFTLSTAPGDAAMCSGASSGLLLSLEGEDALNLLVNGVEISARSGTFLLRATPGGHLEVFALNGEAALAAFGGSADATTGQAATVRLNDALSPIAAPRHVDSFGVDAVAGVPAGLLSAAELPCVAGLPAAGGQVAVRTGPGADRFTSLYYLEPGRAYPAEGWGADSAGGRWWKLSTTDGAENWVEAAQVATFGACASLPEAQARTVAGGRPTTGGGQTGGQTGDNTSALPAGFAPTGNSVWNAEVTVDQLSGTCNSAPLNYCAHLVAIAPSGQSLSYRGQEITPFTLARTGENTYSYSGRNGLNDGNLNLTVTFTSPTTYTATQTLVLDADPACQHTVTVTATRR
ncbi:MAG: hypothetical protein IT323_06390 [Anaerolineae bacterium]|nr:hypothetical protein [Anaerolineae bacterium]